MMGRELLTIVDDDASRVDFFVSPIMRLLVYIRCTENVSLKPVFLMELTSAGRADAICFS